MKRLIPLAFLALAAAAFAQEAAGEPKSTIPTGKLSEMAEKTKAKAFIPRARLRAILVSLERSFAFKRHENFRLEEHIEQIEGLDVGFSLLALPQIERDGDSWSVIFSLVVRKKGYELVFVTTNKKLEEDLHKHLRRYTRPQ